MSKGSAGYDIAEALVGAIVGLVEIGGLTADAVKAGLKKRKKGEKFEKFKGDLEEGRDKLRARLSELERAGAEISDVSKDEWTFEPYGRCMDFYREVSREDGKKRVYGLFIDTKEKTVQSYWTVDTPNDSR